MGPLTPVIYLLHFLVLAGALQLLGKLVGGQGTFEDDFSVVSLTCFLPVFVTMWVFDTPLLVFFPGLPRTDLGAWPASRRGWTRPGRFLASCGSWRSWRSPWTACNEFHGGERIEAWPRSVAGG